ncbi:unnamed protein product [Coregonus sp. 'balchen']|nr:unnamed protein product [Coregonus sp. 'balchen']
MQKQQLEQIQQQANSATSTAKSTQVLVSKTLDSACAQFAATALVTTDQLLALKTKDEEGPGSGVNGLLSPSGVYKGLHLTSTASPSPAAPTSIPSPLTTTTPSSPFLLPSTFNNNGNPHTHTNAAKSTTTQVLMGNNNNLHLSMSSPGGPAGGALTKRNIPRTLSHTHVAVSSSALKLAATANCQMPKGKSGSRQASTKQHIGQHSGHGGHVAS